MRPGAVRARLFRLPARGAGRGLLVAGSRPASAQATATRPGRHVVMVGLSGLRWSDVSPAATPTLWRLAGQGSVGSLVDYAVLPLTCPADGWLTLNSGARAQSDHTNAACGAFPAVVPAGPGRCGPRPWARCRPTTSGSTTTPDWGLLAREAPGCATAVGPGRRAGAGRTRSGTGRVASYLPSPSELTAGVLARCPLTVVDLGNLGYAERSACSPRRTPNSRGSRRTCPRARRCSSPRPGPAPSRRTCSSPWSPAPATGPACWTPPPPGSRAWWCSPT